MSAELDAAAEALEKSCPPDHAPYERYGNELWSFIDRRLPGYGPNWYRHLTERFRIGGAWFNYPLDKSRHHIGNCWLVRPSSALLYAYEVWPLPQLFAHGFCCFADGDDGNVWVFKSADKPDPPVYFIEATAWNGDMPTANNGLYDVGLTFSGLLRYGASWNPDGSASC